jgi:hypothetical protein
MGDWRLWACYNGSIPVGKEVAMSTDLKPLEELMQELPPDMMREVRHFVEFLLSKREPQTEYVLQQNWAGALREQRVQYTSLELQHKA